MKLLIILCAFLTLNAASEAQCNKNVVYNSGKAVFVDSLGNILHSKEGKITVTLTSTEFVLMHDDDEEDALRGDVQNLTCTWKDPYKDGTTSFESGLVEKNGEKSDALVTIEGQHGNLLIQVKFRTRDMKLQIIPTSYDEIK
jgi:hypothetical protein